MESGGISRVINFLTKRPELDQCQAKYQGLEKNLNDREPLQ